MAGVPPKAKHDALILGILVRSVNIFLVESGSYVGIEFKDGTQIACATAPIRVSLTLREVILGICTMLILALDTSSASGSLALLRDSTILAHRVSSSDEPYSASLLRETKELLDRERISFKQIDLFLSLIHI